MKNILLIITVLYSQLGIAQSGSNLHGNSRKSYKGTSVVLINGKIVDYHSGKAVPHIDLQIEGTDWIKTTDSHGQFRFQLPDTFAGKTVVLDVTEKGKLFLDSTGSLIPEVQAEIDKEPYKSAITIYRYPLEVLPHLFVVTTRVSQRDRE